MPIKFDAGYVPRMVVSWLPGGCENRRWGVVMSAENESLSVVPVLAAGCDTKFYDSGGSIETRDRDNVQLKSCPPPNTTLCDRSPVGKCYAYARPKARIDLPLSDAGFIRLRLDDGGKKISEKDYQDILDHLWRDEKEKSCGPGTGRSRLMSQMMDMVKKSRCEPGRNGSDGPDFG